LHFQHRRYVLNGSHNISTKFGADWSNSEEITKVFESQDGAHHHHGCIVDVFYMFLIEVVKFSPNFGAF